MVNLFCGDLTAFAYTPLNSNPDTGQTSVNLFWALLCECIFLICMYHLNDIFPSLKTGKS